MRILSESDVKRCLPVSAAIAANRKALASLRANEDGGACVPTRIGLQYHSKENSSSSSSSAPADWSLFKPAAYYPQPNNKESVDDEILMGIKVVSPRAGNAKLNKPTCPATIMLLDAETGETSAVVAATYLTAARTAAGSALATEMAYSSKSADGNNTLVVFGAGLQGELHIKAIQHLVNVTKVVIVNRSKERAETLKETLLSITQIEQESKTRVPITDISIVLLSDTKAVKEVVELADIIVTATNTTEPLFCGEWPKPGCHINGVGSYTPLMKEIDDALVTRCEVLIDTKEAMDVGDLSSLRNTDDGKTTQKNFGLIGDALVGNVEFGKHRNSQLDCTMFKSVGTAIQDVVTAQHVYEYARKKDIGTTFEM